MSLKLKIAFGLYILNALVLLGFGLRYYLAGELMPYHAEILGVQPDDLPANQWLVNNTLYRAAGAGMLIAGVAVAVLLWRPFRDGLAWSRWALSGVIAIYSALSIHLTLAIQAETSAAVPWPGPVAGLITAVIAYFLTSDLSKPQES